MTDGEKIKAIRKRLGLSLEFLGKGIGVTKSHLSGVENGTKNLSGSATELLKIRCSVSSQWWETGEGGIFTENIQSIRRRMGMNKDIGISIKKPTLEGVNTDVHQGEGTVGDTYINLPRYEVQASAGGGSLVDSEQVVDYLQFRPEWLKNAKGVNPENLLLISVTGDSMEPTLSDGDLIAVDTTQGRFKSDAVYVLQQGDRLWVKRVHYKLDGSVQIKSDNAAKYEPEIFRGDQLENLKIIGRVVWRGGDL